MPFSHDARGGFTAVSTHGEAADATGSTAAGHACPAGPRGCPGPRGPQGPAGRSAPLSDRVDVADSCTGASSQAVKTAYDRGTEALEIALEAKGLLAGQRVRASGNLVLYIRVDGNDANDGLENTPGRALATFEGAKRVMRGLDMGGHVLYVKFGPGTHTTRITFNAGSFCGEESLRICSTDPANPAVFKTTVAPFHPVGYPVFIRIYDVHFQMEDSDVDCMYIDACSVELGSNLVCSGEGRYAVHLVRGSRVHTRDETVLTLRGTYRSAVCANQSSFAHTTGNGRIHCDGTNFSYAGFYSIHNSFMGLGNPVSGTATGRRYYVNYLSQIYTAGAGPDFLPGTVAGVVANGSFYG